MITNEELRISNESYTNKDFISIYPELLNIFKQISPKWNPSLSNESDPGNVILKAMAFLADKVNYNTDKRVLENYLPSVTQETPARNLFEMNGYFPRYYQSAITYVKFRYTGSNLEANQTFTLPAMDTVITDVDNTISYSLMDSVTIGPKQLTDAIPAIQGTFKTLTIGDSDIVQLSNLDDNNRVYLPEIMIAENGVFVFSDTVNANTSTRDSWDRVDNLNLADPENGKCFKFGFDSNKRLPYIEFPANIADNIGSGVRVRYVITAGEAGNISYNFLSKLVSPLHAQKKTNGTLIDDELSFEVSDSSTDNASSDASNLTVYNTGSTINGADPETIDEAYNSYKKTVGTFDTLVTCRDYANAIYNMYDETTSYPYVSNVQVGDRRNDINYSNSMVTYTSLGKEIVIDTDNSNITPYDLCLYPLNPVYNIYDTTSYINSFKPLASDTLKFIKRDIEDYKTISHTYKNLSSTDIYLIKNFYKLVIQIVTTYKVGAVEQEEIKNNIRTALFKNFNARKVDYGYEIPDDAFYDVIKSSDSRIKNITTLNVLTDTKVMLANGNEVSLLHGEDKDMYIHILAKNILAGRLPLFDYDTSFEYDFGQSVAKYKKNTHGTTSWVDVTAPEIPALKSVATYLTVPFEIAQGSGKFEYTLKDDEIIQCIAPSLQSPMTYPAYTNFRWETDKAGDAANVPANTEYTLTGDDTLYINYTDSNKQVINIKYTAYSITKNGRVQPRDPADNPVIIKPNFTMKPTADSSYADGRGATQYDTIVDGVKWFNSLSTQEQIEEREIVSRVINDASLYCYWSTDRIGNRLFTLDDAVYDDDEELLYFERLLGDNEYFAYCDSGMTDVVIRGSGTKLRWYGNAEALNMWICKEQGIEDLIDNGISAFAEFNWQELGFNSNNLEIFAMQILTLASGDTITIGNVTPEHGEVLSNDWTILPPDAEISYTIEGETNTLPTASHAFLAWKIRTRLDINCGPGFGQMVNDNHSFIFTDENDDRYKVEPYTTSSGGEAVDVKPFISLSQLVSAAGGKNVDLTVTKISSTGVSVPECELSAFVYQSDTVSYEIATGGKRIMTKSKGYYTLPISSLKYTGNNSSVTLPVLATPDKTTLIMFYVSKEGASTTPPVYAGDNYTITADKCRKYNSGTSDYPGVTLATQADGEKITVVEVKPDANAVTLTIVRGANEDAECNLVIGVLTKSNHNDDLVLNPAFGLTDDEESDLLDKIAELDTNHKFYYNNPIDKGSAIDASDIQSPDFFWDRNNIFNKFTLGEIDFNEGGTTIDIVNSSRL